MPITSEDIQCNNGTTNFSIHKDITISDYINNYINNGRIEFPRWQRDDCWDDEYRTTLIESIMQKHDLPKIYLSKNTNTEHFYLLDGGHRTRTMGRYITNKFSICIDNENVYYNSGPAQSTRNNRIMNNDEKNIFDNYLLTITIYDNLSETEARKIFNKLQNAKPMSMADIVNSHESPLVDYLRSLETFSIDGQHLCKYFDDYKKVLGKSGNSHMLYQLASWFTVCFPLIIDGDKVDNALNHAHKGEKKDTSLTYKYIADYQEDITPDQKEFFQKYISELIKQVYYFKEIDKQLNPSEITSILHANIYVNNFNIDKFIDFHNDMTQYCKYLIESKNHAKAKNYDRQKEFDILANIINGQFNNKLSEWKKLKSNSNKNGMKVRYDIIKDYCIDDVPTNQEYTDDFQQVPVSGLL